MSTSIISNQMEALQATFAELDILSSEMKPSEQTRNRIAYLLAKQSALKVGITEQQINRAQLDKLRKELGITEDEVWQHRITNPQALADWRAMIADAPEYQRRVAQGKISVRSGQEAGTQSLSYTEGSQGGYLVPFGFDDRQAILMSKYATDQIVDPEFCNEFETGTGDPMSTPVVDDVANTGSSPVVLTAGASAIVSENTVDAQKDIVVGNVAWQAAPTWRSGRIFVSWELFEDAQYGVEGVAGIIEAVVARRHAVGLGQAMITGAGLTGGLTKSLPSGTAITSQASTLDLADFLSLYAELPVAYRQNAVWFMHSNTQLALLQLLEANARSMVNLPTEYLGLPIAVCNSMNAQGAGVPNVVVIADRSYLLKRKAGTSLLTYKEAPVYVEAGKVGFAGLMRADFSPALFGSQMPPVASLNQHS